MRDTLSRLALTGKVLAGAAALLATRASLAGGELYTFTVQGTGGPLNYTATFSVSKPAASIVISSPTPGSNVLSDRDLTTRWALSGPCRL